MNRILVVGSEDRLEEFRNLEFRDAEVNYLDEIEVTIDEVDSGIGGHPFLKSSYQDLLKSYDVVFDLNLDESPERIEFYKGEEDLFVFGSAVMMSLADISGNLFEAELDCHLFGINAFPTFIDRDRFEISCLDGSKKPELARITQELGMQFELVDDRVGMVTPRVVCMIINEACFVYGEGTADIAGVDQAMKLGTNYPKGPFEWADAIGIENVYELLEAIQLDTGDGKYKIAPALKKHYLLGKKFYS